MALSIIFPDGVATKICGALEVLYDYYDEPNESGGLVPTATGLQTLLFQVETPREITSYNWLVRSFSVANGIVRAVSDEAPRAVMISR